MYVDFYLALFEFLIYWSSVLVICIKQPGPTCELISCGMAVLWKDHVDDIYLNSSVKLINDILIRFSILAGPLQRLHLEVSE